MVRLPWCHSSTSAKPPTLACQAIHLQPTFPIVKPARKDLSSSRFEPSHRLCFTSRRFDGITGSAARKDESVFGERFHIVLTCVSVMEIESRLFNFLLPNGRTKAACPSLVCRGDHCAWRFNHYIEATENTLEVEIDRSGNRISVSVE